MQLWLYIGIGGDDGGDLYLGTSGYDYVGSGS